MLDASAKLKRVSSNPWQRSDSVVENAGLPKSPSHVGGMLQGRLLLKRCWHGARVGPKPDVMAGLHSWREGRRQHAFAVTSDPGTRATSDPRGAGEGGGKEGGLLRHAAVGHRSSALHCRLPGRLARARVAPYRSRRHTLHSSHPNASSCVQRARGALWQPPRQPQQELENNSTRWTRL